MENEDMKIFTHEQAVNLLGQAEIALEGVLFLCPEESKNTPQFNQVLKALWDIGISRQPEIPYQTSLV